MLVLPWTPRRVPTRPKGRPRPAQTGTWKDLSSSACGASTLPIPESKQPVTRDGYSHSPRLQHRKRDPVNGHRDQSCPSCARIEKSTQGRLGAARSPAPLSNCLSRTRSRRNDPIPNNPRKYVMDEESSFDLLPFFAKRNDKLSVSVGPIGAV